MATYLQTNKPTRSQFRVGRRELPTGTIVLHTAEIAADLVGEDLGAEKIARFIQTRSTAGSYHLIGDRDSEIHLVPFEWEAFGDGTGSNPWAIHISLAITAAWFRAAPNEQKLWYMARLATMCRRASNWLEAVHGITVPARRLTKATAKQAGICTHMDRETWAGTPGRRTDPWGNSDPMWDLFLELYEDTAERSQEDDMQKNQIVWLRAPNGTGAAYHLYGSGVAKWLGPAGLNLARYLGVPEVHTQLDSTWQETMAIVDGPCKNV